MKPSSSLKVVMDDQLYFTFGHDEMPGNERFYTKDNDQVTANFKYSQKKKFEPKLLVWVAIGEEGHSDPFFVGQRERKCLPRGVFLASFSAIPATVSCRRRLCVLARFIIVTLCEGYSSLFLTKTSILYQKMKILPMCHKSDQSAILGVFSSPRYMTAVGQRKQSIS